MMGCQSGTQDSLFYSFDLDAVVPSDHLLRGIDVFLDLTDLREHLRPFYSHTGRPSIDPELMIRMLIVGYCFGIRSERQLCEEVRLNLAYRWFCRLGLEDTIPDHSTFSKNRHARFRASDLFRRIFESVLKRCINEGLVGGEGFAVDASLIRADANRQRHSSVTELMADTGTRPRAVQDYIAALDLDTLPSRKVISPTDPASQWTAAAGGLAFFAYSANYLIDLDVGIIVDSETTKAHRTEEVGATRTMIDRVEKAYNIKPKRLAADTAYGAAPMLAWVKNEKGIEPHIPVFDKSSGKAGLFPRSAFSWKEEENHYVCPGDKKLTTTGTVTKDNTILYRTFKSDCTNCPLKPTCCPNTSIRKIARSVHETVRDYARALQGTAAYIQSHKDRKKVEMSFAHLKRILKLDRLRLRGLSGAKDELLMAATAQNLRKMANLIWKPPKYHGRTAPA